MSKSFESGIREAVLGGFGGFILNVVLDIIPTLPSIPSYYVGIVQLLKAVLLIGGIPLIFAMESWGLGYLLGWLVGMWMMSTVGLVESWMFTLYAVVGIVVVLGKIVEKVEKYWRNL